MYFYAWTCILGAVNRKTRVPLPNTGGFLVSTPTVIAESVLVGKADVLPAAAQNTESRQEDGEEGNGSHPQADLLPAAQKLQRAGKKMGRVRTSCQILPHSWLCY